jgi:hypothetical protein
MEIGDCVVIGSDDSGLHGCIVAIVHLEQYAPGYESWSDSTKGVLVDTVEAGHILYDCDEVLAEFRKEI